MGEGTGVCSEAVPCKEVLYGEVPSAEIGFSLETETEGVLSLKSSGCGEAIGGVGVCTDAECSE